MLLDADKINIYDLTSKMIHGTRCVISVQLCTRVALMVRIPASSDLPFTDPPWMQHKVVLKHKGDKFWDKVDEKLEHIRKTANNDKSKIAKYVCPTIASLYIANDI